VLVTTAVRSLVPSSELTGASDRVQYRASFCDLDSLRCMDNEVERPDPEAASVLEWRPFAVRSLNMFNLTFLEDDRGDVRRQAADKNMILAASDGDRLRTKTYSCRFIGCPNHFKARFAEKVLNHVNGEPKSDAKCRDANETA
jgi:hypothetical protein